MPWVQLLCNQSITRKGVITHHKKGDWVSIGRQTAENWIAGGCAVAIDQEAIDQSSLATSGIFVRGMLDDEWRDKFKQASGLQLAFAGAHKNVELPFTETLIWSPCHLRLDLLMKGFELLKKGWQIVVPLWNYELLAVNVGTDEDRKAAKEVLRDLRVPLRDTRVVYVRRCEATRHVVNEWNRLRLIYSDERLALLQALYTVKPLVCDVPASWTGNVV